MHTSARGRTLAFLSLALAGSARADFVNGSFEQGTVGDNQFGGYADDWATGDGPSFGDYFGTTMRAQYFWPPAIDGDWLAVLWGGLTQSRPAQLQAGDRVLLDVAGYVQAHRQFATYTFSLIGPESVTRNLDFVLGSGTGSLWTDWITIGLDVPTTGTYVLSIYSTGWGGTADGWGTLLADNVRVISVPVPGTAAVLCLGGLLATRRRSASRPMPTWPGSLQR